MIQTLLCLADDDVIRPDDLPEFIRADSPQPGSDRTTSKSAASSSESKGPRPLKEVLEETERLHIVRTLEFTKGNKRKAIEILRISPDTFYKRLEQFGLHKKRG